MTIWVDADCCSRSARRILLRLSKRLGVLIVFVSNQELRIQNSNLIRTVQVSRNDQATDTYILQSLQSGDFVVTRDLFFAQKALNRGAVAINDRGKQFNTDNIGLHISERNNSESLRNIGLHTPSPRKQRKDYSASFSHSLEKAIHQQQFLHTDL